MCCQFLCCRCSRSNMDLRTKQAWEIYVTFTMGWSQPRTEAFWSSMPIHNASLSKAVKKFAVVKYHPHDVVACDENGHVSSHFPPLPTWRIHRRKPWLTWSNPNRQSLVKERSFKQDKVTAQSSEPLNSVWITATKTRKNRKPRAKFMISRSRTIIF